MALRHNDGYISQSSAGICEVHSYCRLLQTAVGSRDAMHALQVLVLYSIVQQQLHYFRRMLYHTQ
jgi:hypothetical protein